MALLDIGWLRSTLQILGILLLFASQILGGAIVVNWKCQHFGCVAGTYRHPHFDHAWFEGTYREFHLFDNPHASCRARDLKLIANKDQQLFVAKTDCADQRIDGFFLNSDFAVVRMKSVRGTKSYKVYSFINKESFDRTDQDLEPSVRLIFSTERSLDQVQ